MHRAVNAEPEEIVMPQLPVVATADKASVTRTVKEKEPAVVGVPLITPVDAFSASPGGNDPELSANEYGAVPPITPMSEL
jgi:hypothetical protein